MRQFLGMLMAGGFCMAAHGAILEQIGPTAGPGQNIIPTAISADGGTVVGSTYTGGGGIGQVFRWTTGGGYQNLGISLNSNGHVAVSGDGTTIVATTTVPLPSGGGFRWTASGGLQQLAPAPYFLSRMSQARTVNMDGSMVAGATFAPGTGYAFVTTWNAAGTPAVPVPTDVDWSTSDMSASGAVLVGTGQTITNSGIHRPVRWTNGVLKDLGASNPNFEGYGNAVSEDGRFTVGSGRIAPFEQGRMFRWDLDGTALDCGTPAGSLSASAEDANADGSVLVGNCFFSSGLPHGALWTASLGVVDLNVYLPTLGIDLGGWTLTQCSGVSADGRTIAALGQLGNQYRAWRISGLEVPNASTAGGFAVAFGALVRRRRRSLRAE